MMLKPIKRFTRQSLQGIWRARVEARKGLQAPTGGRNEVAADSLNGRSDCEIPRVRALAMTNPHTPKRPTTETSTESGLGTDSCTAPSVSGSFAPLRGFVEPPKRRK